MVFAATTPTAQSEVWAIISHSARIFSGVSASASPLSTLPKRRSTSRSPSRQGTHLPQDWFMDICRIERYSTSGHMPGG